MVAMTPRTTVTNASWLRQIFPWGSIRCRAETTAGQRAKKLQLCQARHVMQRGFRMQRDGNTLQAVSKLNIKNSSTLWKDIFLWKHWNVSESKRVLIFSLYSFLFLIHKHIFLFYSFFILFSRMFSLSLAAPHSAQVTENRDETSPKVGSEWNQVAWTMTSKSSNLRIMN